MRFEELIKRVRLSTTQVVGSERGVARSMPIGTGFLVGEGRHLITALHVVNAANGEMMFAGLAGVDRDEPDLKIRGMIVYIPMQLVATDAANDLALFELLMMPAAVSADIMVENLDTGEMLSSGRTGPMKFSDARVLEGTEIAVSGFPLSAPSLVTTRGTVASTFAPLDPSDPNSPIAYLCDVTAIYGNSGGPVYRTSDGSLVGLCRAVKIAGSASSPHAVPLLVATPVEHIVDLLRANDVPIGHAALRPSSTGQRTGKKRQ